MDGRRDDDTATSSPVRELVGGTMRASDPRRFLVEVMVGAIQADGRVDDAERAALQRILEENELFTALSDQARAALVDLASDALLFAGGARPRLERIAVALPWRLHRLAAYAMAAELVAADEVVTRDEEGYLGALRAALVIGGEAEELHAAARRGRPIPALDALSQRVPELMDKAARVCVAMASAAGGLGRDDVERIERVFRGLLDFRGAEPVTRERIERLATELPASLDEVCAELSGRIREPAERYWASAYALCVEASRAPGTLAGWRRHPLAPVLRQAFEMSEQSMDRCEAHGGRMAELVSR